MDDAEKRRLGEAIEPGSRPAAPGALRLVQRFLNTWNHEFPPEWDRLGSGRAATRWLRSAGVLTSRERVSDDDAERLRAAREALKEVVVSTERERPAAARALAAVVGDGRIALVVRLSDPLILEPAGDGADRGLAAVLAHVHESQLLGTWPRLKACRQCRWVFYDRSKNRSAAWCAMAICGNRTKNQTYRSRRAPETGEAWARPIGRR